MSLSGSSQVKLSPSLIVKQWAWAQIHSCETDQLHAISITIFGCQSCQPAHVCVGNIFHAAEDWWTDANNLRRLSVNCFNHSKFLCASISVNVFTWKNKRGLWEYSCWIKAFYPMRRMRSIEICTNEHVSQHPNVFVDCLFIHVSTEPLATTKPAHHWLLNALFSNYIPTAVNYLG